MKCRNCRKRMLSVEQDVGPDNIIVNEVWQCECGTTLTVSTPRATECRHGHGEVVYTNAGTVFVCSRCGHANR